MNETKIHPETGMTLRRATREQTITFGSLSKTIDVPGWYPEDDSDALYTGADLKDSDEAYKALREQYGAYVKKVRQSLRMTQEDAGTIIGGGKRAFQKYESGSTTPSDAAIGLIEVLAHHPETITTLRILRQRPISAVSKSDKGKIYPARKHKRNAPKNRDQSATTTSVQPSQANVRAVPNPAQPRR